jgi:hypothetical protein
MRPDEFNREYPTSAAQALEAAGERFFRSTDIDAAGENADGLQPHAEKFVDYRGRERHRRYAIGVDVGFKRDETCIVCLDHTDDSFSVAYYVSRPASTRSSSSPSVSRSSRAVASSQSARPVASSVSPLLRWVVSSS